MALQIDVRPGPAVDAETLLRIAASEIDGRCAASIASIADVFVAYASRPGLAAHLASKALAHLVDAKPLPFYSPQSFVIASHQHVLLRGNLWMPTASLGPLRSREEEVFSYHRAHDHNFHFLTYGYSGPGYETELFEIDPSTLTGAIGDRARIVARRKAVLEPGSVMLYRAHVDAHIQRPPAKLSLSINLMFNHPALTSQEQYWFDVESDHLRVTGYPEGNKISRQAQMLRTAALLPDASVREALAQISRNPGLAPRVRAAAV
ncbi:MAG: hypothetical protein KatS3mg127_0564 [Silanimonas sp.]|jgi:hypothetical protein|nr:MAG: hypothetical protein KatS3mg127_0564 [Silanimonas sp.]